MAAITSKYCRERFMADFANTPAAVRLGIIEGLQVTHEVMMTARPEVEFAPSPMEAEQQRELDAMTAEFIPQ